MEWKSSQRVSCVNSDPSASQSMQIMRRLMAREPLLESGAEPAVVGIALQRTCARVSHRLRDAMGVDGSTALLARALARTEVDHPVLKTVTHLNGNGISLDGVSASIDAHGVTAVTAGVEALLAALVDVLSRLIGEDMTARLLELDAPARSRTGGKGHAS